MSSQPNDRAAARPLAFEPSVQGLRGIAALLVVLYHASEYARRMLAADLLVVGIFDSRLGLYGVAIFFAISGYLMAEIARRQDAALFLAHRAIRIYPMFWIASALAMLAFWSIGAPLSMSFFGSLLMPAGPVDQPLGVEWTLVYEVTFYCVVAAAIALGAARWLPAIGVAWATVALAAQLAGLANPLGGATYYFHDVLLSARTDAFALGLAIPWLLERYRPPLWLLVLPAGAFFAYQSLPYRQSEPVSGIAAVVLLAVAIDRFRGDARALRGLPAVFMRLGDWSYALYLCHVPVVRLVYLVGQPREVSPAVLWLVAVGAALVVAGILGAIDVALYRRLKGRLRGASRRWVDGIALLFVVAFVAALIHSITALSRPT